MVAILHGYKATNKLCIISVTEQDKQPVLEQLQKTNIKDAVNNIYSVSSKIEIITYYHKFLLSPANSTWIEAMKKWFFDT